MLELPAGLWSLSPLAALTGVLVIIFWLIATGRLIPKSSHERELEQANRRGDEWKETANDLRAVNAEIRKQNGQLLDANVATESFFRAVSPGNLTDTGGRDARP